MGGTLSTDAYHIAEKLPGAVVTVYCNCQEDFGPEGKHKKIHKPKNNPKAIFSLEQKPTKAEARKRTEARRKKARQRAPWLRSGELEDKIPRPSIGLIPRGPGEQQTQGKNNVHATAAAYCPICHARYCCESCEQPARLHPGHRVYCVLGSMADLKNKERGCGSNDRPVETGAGADGKHERPTKGHRVFLFQVRDDHDTKDPSRHARRWQNRWLKEEKREEDGRSKTWRTKGDELLYHGCEQRPVKAAKTKTEGSGNTETMENSDENDRNDCGQNLRPKKSKNHYGKTARWKCGGRQGGSREGGAAVNRGANGNRKADAPERRKRHRRKGVP